MRLAYRLAAVLGWWALGLTAVAATPPSAPAPGKVRTYYVAADEVEWDYAPGGINKMMGAKFEGYAKTFTEKGPHRIGTVYRKAVYREYTDETFTHLKPRPPEWEHLGMLGPVLRAEVGAHRCPRERHSPYSSQRQLVERSTRGCP